MINIVITCDTTDDRDTAVEIEDWIRDGEFDAEITVRIEGPA